MVGSLCLEVTASGGGGGAGEGAGEDPPRGLSSKIRDKTWSWPQTFHTGPSRHRAAR